MIVIAAQPSGADLTWFYVLAPLFALSGIVATLCCHVRACPWYRTCATFGANTCCSCCVSLPSESDTEVRPLMTTASQQV